MIRALTRGTTSISFGPFNHTTQTRWRRKPIISEQAKLEARSEDPNLYQKHLKKKPTISARTRLETRPKIPKLDHLTRRLRRLNLILSLHRLISSYHHRFISLNLFANRAPHAGLNLSVHRPGAFLRKYPHIFHTFNLPETNNRCCKLAPAFAELLEMEDSLLSSEENRKLSLSKLKRILGMSVEGSVHLQSIRLMRRELGLPEDFIESIIVRYDGVFRLVEMEIVELVGWDEGRGEFVAEVEKWRRKEFEEKWLGELDVEYTFPMNFPDGFKRGTGFKERLRNWQMLPYVKPYERLRVVRGNCRGSAAKYEKRAVAIIHEILCLTVEKRMEVERLSHFRKDLGIMVNIRELLLKHPGIFYISIRGNNQMLFLREAYDKWCLIEPNPIYDVRRKMLDLLLLGTRNTDVLVETKPKEETKEETSSSICQQAPEVPMVGDFVLEILASDTNDRI